ncbi:unnamed protein product [Bursaphelenchus xylophilus]|uniref:(pine wood nematode) hypothetical protein n=1 Tax=Bursaphelenchus xylophilus TaxID=6326 RepID=A0A1I7RN33_BURXY|nr:unnamed protein product [Bursaphelenchus xylophilus]CAG9087642.1 unnamed protein product [Bursaphelenchus xylophilus]
MIKKCLSDRSPDVLNSCRKRWLNISAAPAKAATSHSSATIFPIIDSASKNMRRKARVSALTTAPLTNGSVSGEEVKDLPPPESHLYDAEMDEFRQLFDMFDADGSGAIGNEELKEAIMSLGQNISDQEIEDLIKEVDEDGNGEIDFDEFCRCMRKSQRMKLASNEEFVKQCFSVFDQDGNGVITKNEFKYIAKEIGGFTDELAENIFQELDVSANGHLSADQFAAIVEDYMLNDQGRLYDEKITGPQRV